MDNLWVLIVLLVVGGTIVTVRLFRNGAREELEPAAEAAPAAKEPAASVGVWAAIRATPVPFPPLTADDAPAAAACPGGDCPACGTPTVPSAKFCGSCGHRLTA